MEMSKGFEPSLEDFLVAPVDEVVTHAPATLIFAAGGTRRAAALAHIPIGDEYVRWSRPRMLNCFSLFFRLGIKHLIAPSAIPKMFAEQGPIRKQWLPWMKWGLAGPESLAFYEDANWRVHLVVAGEASPELTDIAQRLEQATHAASGPHLWYIATPNSEDLWTWQCQAFIQGARTRTEVVRALYGGDIPPASLLVSFGKPIIGPDVVPPFLANELQCYWTQRPGYEIDECELRTILYDYAFLRSTWRQDKTGRAEEALPYRAAWEHGPTLGVGMRLGPFWYPATVAPERVDQETELPEP